MLTVPVEYKKYPVEDFNQFLKHPAGVKYPLKAKKFLIDCRCIYLDLIHSGNIVKSALIDIQLK